MSAKNVEVELRKAAIGGALACQLHITDSFTLEAAPLTKPPALRGCLTNDDSVALTRSVPPEYLADRQMLMYEVSLFKLFRMR